MLSFSLVINARGFTHCRIFCKHARCSQNNASCDFLWFFWHNTHNTAELPEADFQPLWRSYFAWKKITLFFSSAFSALVMWLKVFRFIFGRARYYDVATTVAGTVVRAGADNAGSADAAGRHVASAISQRPTLTPSQSSTACSLSALSNAAPPPPPPLLEHLLENVHVVCSFRSLRTV